MAKSEKLNDMDVDKNEEISTITELIHHLHFYSEREDWNDLAQYLRINLDISTKTVLAEQYPTVIIIYY